MNRTRVPMVVPSIALGAALALLVAGCGGHGPQMEGSSVSALVTLQGYTFNGTSNVLTHPWMNFGPTAGVIMYPGWGTAALTTLKHTFSNGGPVGPDAAHLVKTLKLVTVIPGQTTHALWLAQDSLGNVHILQKQDGGLQYKVGVAATPYYSPAFFLQQDGALTVGAVWWDVNGSNQKIVQRTVISRTASKRGRSGLLQIREITDATGAGNFSPTPWPGRRVDYYFDASDEFWTLQTAANGGYTLPSLDLRTGVAKWQLTAGPAGAVPPLAPPYGYPAPVTTPVSGWVIPTSPAKWVGTSLWNQPTGDFWYELDFCLCPTISRAEIDLTLWADNSAVLYLNTHQKGDTGLGTPTVPPSAGPGLSVLITTDFIVGTNKLTVCVHNRASSGGSPTPTGMLIQGMLSGVGADSVDSAHCVAQR